MTRTRTIYSRRGHRWHWRIISTADFSELARGSDLRKANCRTQAHQKHEELKALGISTGPRANREQHNPLGELSSCEVHSESRN